MTLSWYHPGYKRGEKEIFVVRVPGRSGDSGVGGAARAAAAPAERAHRRAGRRARAGRQRALRRHAQQQCEYSERVPGEGSPPPACWLRSVHQVGRMVYEYMQSRHADGWIRMTSLDSFYHVRGVWQSRVAVVPHVAVSEQEISVQVSSSRLVSERLLLMHAMSILSD